MAIRWSTAVDKHGISRAEIVWAMSNPHHVVPEFGRARPGFASPPTLFIGPSRFGTLEVLASTQPPDDVFVFHAMVLRHSTAVEAMFEGDDA